jgi:hypothetical protein
VIRKIRRLEDQNVDSGSLGVENDPRVPELGTPSLLKQLTTHRSLDPAPGKAVQLVMVGTAWRKAAVHRETKNGLT